MTTPSINQNPSNPTLIEKAIGFGIGTGINMGINYGFGYTIARVFINPSRAHDLGVHSALTIPSREAVNYCFNKVFGDARENRMAIMAVNVTASITAAYVANQLGYAINEYDVAYQQMMGVAKIFAINIGSIALVSGLNYLLGEDITQSTPAVASAEIQDETAPQPALPEEQIENIIKTPMMIKA